MIIAAILSGDAHLRESEPAQNPSAFFRAVTARLAWKRTVCEINCLSRRYIAIKIVGLIAEPPVSCVIIARDISDLRNAKVTSLVAIGHL